MKTPRSARTTTAIAATHHLKSSRRQHGLPSHFEMSLRLTSIFIIAIAVCEFSGLSQAVADAYTAVAIRISSSFISSSTSSSSSSTIKTSSTDKSSLTTLPNSSTTTTTTLHHHATSSSSFLTTFSTDTFSKLSSNFSKVPDDSPLTQYYVGLHPDATVSTAQNDLSILEKKKKKNKVKTESKKDTPMFSLETHWSKEDMDIKICRIHNACIRNIDGALLVHPKLKRYASPLRECQVRKLDYFSNAENEYDEDSPFSSLDLFGATPARFHIPHFLTDVLPVLYASELIWPTSEHGPVRSDCVEPNRYSRCTESKDKMNAALFVEDRVMRMKVTAWVPQFAALMPGTPYLISPESMALKQQEQSDKIPELTCFKSVVSFPRHVYMLKSPDWFADGNRMFTSNGLTRSTVIREPTSQMPSLPSLSSSSSVDSVTSQTEENSTNDSKPSDSEEDKKKENEMTTSSSTFCPVHIVFINRAGWEKRHGVHLGRDLPNLEDVKTKIQSDAPKSKSPRVVPFISVHFFENLTFAQQVRVMQNADVIIGVHGAGLSNMVFARRDTPLLEVFPFSYYAGPFNGVANSLGLNYAFMVAEPDTKRFLDCVEFRTSRMGDEKIATHAKDLWTQALKKRRMEGELEFLKTHTFTDPAGSIMKMCARSQSLVVDVTEMSRKVLQMAQSVCGADVEF